MGLMALTPTEKKIVQHAKDSLIQAQGDLKKQQDYAQWADNEQQQAWAFAATQKQQIDGLQEDIKKAHDNEQTMANEVAKMKPFWDKGHKYWGIGAIMLGFGILVKHLLILTAFLILLGLAIWILSFFVPWLKIPLAFVQRFFNWAASKIKGKPKL